MPHDCESFFQCLFKAMAQMMPGIQMAIYSLDQESQQAHRFSSWLAGSLPVQISAKNDPVVACLLREGAAEREWFVPPRPSGQSVLNLPLDRPGETIGFVGMGFQGGQRITIHELDLALLMKELLSSFVAIFNYSRPLSTSISSSAFQIISAILKPWLV